MRHFLGWEIADIGVLLFVRRAGKIQRRKVALLQSKRLYPTNKLVSEETKIDFEIGFPRLADPEDLRSSIAVRTEFEFSEDCTYDQLRAGSDQVKAISKYEKMNSLSVHYQLYNPWTLPFVQRIPLAGYARLSGELSMGTRIIPADVLHRILSRNQKGYSPSPRALVNAIKGSPYGWSLEHFVVGLFLDCQEGSKYDEDADERIQDLFYRRSGPIAAAIAITIEEPQP